MIEFFRDVISGPVYIVAVILSIIFIMAIIGFLMERKKLEKEHNKQVAVVANTETIQPINPVTVEKEVITATIQTEITTNNMQDNLTHEVKKPTIIFSEPDETHE